MKRDQTSVRLEPELTQRAQRLVEAMLERADYKRLGVTRADVLRMALDEGLWVLEQRFELRGAKGGRKQRGQR